MVGAARDRARVPGPGNPAIAGTKDAAPANLTAVRAPTETHEEATVSGDAKLDSSHEPLLYTARQAADLLQVSPSWLRKKASARAVPCTFIGKHLRFSPADIATIIAAGEQAPRITRPRQPTGRTESTA
ncbi:MAG: helix-turn-helix domain-containing protein [Micromonosporaceae bacterium]|nr:helix-turn-helix domain-containing protein [Micromonosporaceae bacterium]